MSQCFKKYEHSTTFFQFKIIIFFCFVKREHKWKSFPAKSFSYFLSIDFSSQDPFVFKNHVLTKKDFPYSRASHWFLLTKEWIQSLLRNFFSLSFLLTKEFKVYWKLFFIIYLKCQKHFTWKLNLWRFILKFLSGFIFKFHT